MSEESLSRQEELVLFLFVVCMHLPSIQDTKTSMEQQPTKTTQNTLTVQDWKNAGRNLFIFGSPTIIAFLVSLQNAYVLGKGIDWQVPVYMGIQALLASVIDLATKYKN